MKATIEVEIDIDDICEQFSSAGVDVVMTGTQKRKIYRAIRILSTLLDTDDLLDLMSDITKRNNLPVVFETNRV